MRSEISGLAVVPRTLEEHTWKRTYAPREIALAIEMDAEDLALTLHAHPTLHESVGLSAEIFEGVITDLPNKKAGARRASAVQV